MTSLLRRRSVRRLSIALTLGTTAMLFAGCSFSFLDDASTEQGASGYDHPHLQFHQCPSNDQPYGTTLFAASTSGAALAEGEEPGGEVPTGDEPTGGDTPFVRGCGGSTVVDREPTGDTTLRAAIASVSPASHLVVGVQVPDAVAVDGEVTYTTATSTYHYVANDDVTAAYESYFPAPAGSHWLGYRSTELSGTDSGEGRYDFPVADDATSTPSDFPYVAVAGSSIEGPISTSALHAAAPSLTAGQVQGIAKAAGEPVSICLEDGGYRSCDATSDMDFSSESATYTPITLDAHIKRFGVAAVGTPAAVNVSGSTDAGFSVTHTGVDLADDETGAALTATTDVPGGTVVSSAASARPSATTPVAVTVHVTVPAGTATGDYHVTLTGTGDSAVHTATATFHVTAAAAAPLTAVAGATAAPVVQPFFLLSSAFSHGCTLLTKPHGCNAKAGSTITVTGKLLVKPFGTAAVLELGTAQRVTNVKCIAASHITYAKAKDACTSVKRTWHKVKLGAQDSSNYYSWSQTFPNLPKGTYVIAARVTSGTYHQTVIGAPLQLVIR